MNTTQRGLGRGLEALFSSQHDRNSAHSSPPQDIPIECIEPNPYQPRKHFDEDRLQDLAQSIRQQGVLQPILLRPAPQKTDQYQIIAGERRWRAAVLAEIATVPAIIREISDSQSLIIGLVENLQREDLNPIEEAEALEALQQELHLSHEELAQKLGRSRPSISNGLRLLQLEPSIREAVRNGNLTSGAARSLLAIHDTEQRLLFFAYILRHKISVRQIEASIAYWKKHGRLPKHITEHNSPCSESGDSFFDHFKSKVLSQLNTRFNCQVRISGTQSNGRITFSYSSEGQLQSILDQIGLSPSHVSRET